MILPDFVRRAIEAQGAVDPDVVERQAAELADATEPERVTAEQAALFNQPQPRAHWQEPDR